MSHRDIEQFAMAMFFVVLAAALPVAVLELTKDLRAPALSRAAVDAASVSLPAPPGDESLAGARRLTR